MQTCLTDLLEKHYGLQGTAIAPLDGYESENYRVESASGRFVLKIYRQAPRTLEVLSAENEVMKKLWSKSPESFPRPVCSITGEELVQCEQGILRLLSFVEGDFVADVAHTDKLLISFGRFLAHMNLETREFSSSAIEARRIDWDLQYGGNNERLLAFIADVRDRSVAEYFFLQNREMVQPHLSALRFSIIHGDANYCNVLARDGEVSGIIDFGDVCYSPLINELAVAATYAMMDKTDPIPSVELLVAGYSRVLPLQEPELKLFYNLVATRLCISVCKSAEASVARPENAYLTISQQSAWRLLYQLLRINPARFEDRLRKACGYESNIRDTIPDDIDRRRKHTSSALSLQFATPIKMERAAFQYMYDSLGNTFLDCYNNIPQVGHCHPHVVQAGQRAMAQINTNTRYLSDSYNGYAERLLEKFPPPLDRIFIVNSGSAATDLAIRLSMTHSRNRGVAVMQHGYHGNTQLGIEISHYKYSRRGGTGRSASIIEAELPDTYRGDFPGDEDATAIRYAERLERAVQDADVKVAAFIAEPIVGCGGQVPLARNYLNTVYSFIRMQGGLCISDEVQTGFGRLGRYFWGFEMHGVVPDIVVLGKPMGNGHPMAAVVTTAEIAGSFETGMEFFSSFGGNPVSCSIGSAVLDVLENESLPENAKDVGEYLLHQLDQLCDDFEVCGNARGEGLFLGLDIVYDRESKKPHTASCCTSNKSFKGRRCSCRHRRSIRQRSEK